MTVMELFNIYKKKKIEENIKIIKIIVIGDSNVGKSTMSEYYITNQINIESTATIGIEFYTKLVDYNEKKFRLHIWDTAGQEQFQSISRVYYHDATCAIICFSLIDKKSFDNLPNHINEVEKLCPKNTIKILVGTHCDKEEVINDSEVNKILEEINCKYIKVSSMTGENIKEVFDTLIENIDNNMKVKQTDLDNILDLEKKNIENNIIKNYIDDSIKVVNLDEEKTKWSLCCN